MEKPLKQVYCRSKEGMIMKKQYLTMLAVGIFTTMPISALAEEQNSGEALEAAATTEIVAEDLQDSTHIGDKTIKPKNIAREMPRFSMIGKEGKFYVGIGGVVQATASFDFGHVMDNPNEFIVSSIPMQQASGDGGKFQVSAQQTNLFVQLGFLPGDKYEVSAYINGQFIGNNYAFELEHAYLKFLGFTAGYGYGIFCDQDAMPTTIDFQGPNAALSTSNGIFDYQYDINKKWSIGAGIELPMASFTTVVGMTRKVNQRVPDFPLMVQYNFGDGGHIRAAGILRTLQYRDELVGKNRSVCGWGAQLSGAGTLYGPLQFVFEAAIGKGISSYFQDLADLNLDMTPDPSKPGHMQAVNSWGGYAGLQYNFSSKVFASATYSHLRTYLKAYSEGDVPFAEQYKYGQYAVANVFWNITSMLQWGVEYIYGRRVNMDGSQAHDNRFQTMLAVSF